VPAIFSEFASVCDQIKSTRSKNEKVKILATYIKTLDDESLRISCMFLSGHSFPKGSGLDLNVGYSLIWDVIAEVSNLTPNELRNVYLKHGDLGELAEQALAKRKIEPLIKNELTLDHVYEQFRKIANTAGQGSTEDKKKMIMGLIINCSPVEAKYLAKIMVNEFRIGLVEGLVEIAIAEAFARDLNDVREAFLVAGDIGYVAVLAKNNKLSSAVMQPFTPINFMLADVMFSAKEIAEYFNRPLISEYKYDGIRAQMHKFGDKIRIFSRRLEDITTPFPEVVDAALQHKSDFILDGEIVPFRNDKPLPFNDLQRRLRRKNVDRELIDQIPVVYIAYDILYFDGSSKIKEQLTNRKKVLNGIEFRSPITNSAFSMLDSEESITRMFEESRSLGHEGLVLKDPSSTYQPGKRGKHWVKLKKELDTIDAVIVIAEFGHGKRAGVLSDYTFAVNDNEELKIIGKAYSGLTDEEIDEMTSRLKSLMIRDESFRIIVRPEIVLEVAFDGIQTSDRHDSGYALRFPRIKRIRYDKSVNDIDTLDKVRSIYTKQTVV
jgi:DNA ligase-1